MLEKISSKFYISTCYQGAGGGESLPHPAGSGENQAGRPGGFGIWGPRRRKIGRIWGPMVGGSGGKIKNAHTDSL